MVDVTLTATSGDDLINVRLLEYTSLTNIVVDLGSGNDVYRGWDGKDTVNGGRGVDYIYGGFGNDRIKAGRSDDYVDAGHGDDFVWGGSGNDYIKAGPGNDLINGGNGHDIIFGVKGQNLLRGQNGNDTIDTGVHSSRVQGGRGEDTIYIDLSKGARHTVAGNDDADMFIFTKIDEKRSSITTVEDFEIGVDGFEIDGVDHIMFMATYLSGASSASIRDGENGAEIILSSRDLIRLDGVTVEDLTDHYDTFILA